MTENISNFTEIGKILKNDLNIASIKFSEAYQNNSDVDFYARSYLRAFASWVEGMIWLIKHFVGNSEKELHKKLSIESQLYIFEYDWKISNSGKPCLTSKRIGTKDNIKAIFHVFNELFPAFSVDFNDSGWNDLMHFYSLRDKMMHPKNLQSLTVTKEDILRCESGRAWLNGNFTKLSALF